MHDTYEIVHEQVNGSDFLYANIGKQNETRLLVACLYEYLKNDDREERESTVEPKSTSFRDMMMPR